MAGNYYKIGYYDVRNLALMIGQLSDSRNRVKRAEMVLFCWHKMWSNRTPCDYFTCGIKTIAEKCAVSEKAARCFLERAESDGWLIRIGTLKNKTGEYVKRTFVWVAEEAAESKGMSLSEWLAAMDADFDDGVGYALLRAEGYAPQGAGSLPFPSGKRAEGYALSAEGKGIQQNAKHSEGGRFASPTHSGLLAPLDGMEEADLTPAWMDGGGSDG